MLKLPLYTILKGGLGNQLFIFANSLVYSKIQNKKLILNLIWYETDQLKNLKKNGYQNPDLLKFPLIKSQYHNKLSIISKLVYKVFLVAQKFGDKLILNIASNLDITKVSHKQSHCLIIYGDMIESRFLTGIRDELLGLLKLDRLEEEKLKIYFNKLRTSNNRIVALHVRRGDRIALDTHYNVLSKDYYLRCINDKVNEKDTVLIFSDDLPWCKENLKLRNSIFFENSNPVINFRAMSLCDDFILSTSTFGWWAAWLGNAPDKKVVVPNPYVQDKPMAWRDLVQEGWTQCEATWAKI